MLKASFLPKSKLASGRLGLRSSLTFETGSYQQEAGQRTRSFLLGVVATACTVGGLASCSAFQSEKTDILARQGAPPSGSAELQPASAAPHQPAVSKKDDSMWHYVRTLLGGQAPHAAEMPLPTDKLSCKRSRHRDPAASYRPVVLVSCGSFNPPTLMHLRMFELAAQQLTQEGCDVLGGYMSPVNDSYGKSGLAAAQHRLRMCELAAADSPLIMVDGWEAAQPQYQRSLAVLRRTSTCLQASFNARPSSASRGSEGRSPSSPPPTAHQTDSPSGSTNTATQDAVSGLVEAPTAVPRTILLCGADLLESFASPGVWKEDHMREILGHHGVVCIARKDSPVEQLLKEKGSMLNTYRSKISIIHDPVQSDISSTTLRAELHKGHSVRYLTPTPVLDYIHKHGLYQ